ncbi:Thymidine kinase [Cucumispora dikerogammari]|nr:Thymidine kinase [Cucumispora dikerogammari]
MSLTLINGTMSSSKTALLLMFKYSHPTNCTSIKTAMPFLGQDRTKLQTRAPLNSCDVDIIIKQGDSSWVNNITEEVKFLLIDECQFLDKDNVVLIKEISKKICVLCYGLSRDFLNNEFEGSKALNLVADTKISLPSLCGLCYMRLAQCNMRESNGKMVLGGPVVALKDQVNYISVCFVCYDVKKNEALK